MNHLEMPTLDIASVNPTFSAGTYGSGISVFLQPTSNDSGDSSKWLAHSSTSLGPIRDYRNHKLYFNYSFADGSFIGAACDYDQYK